MLGGHAPTGNRSPQEPVHDVRQVPRVGDGKGSVALAHEALDERTRVGFTRLGIDVHIATHPPPVGMHQEEVLGRPDLHLNALSVPFEAHYLGASERNSLVDGLGDPFIQRPFRDIN